MSDYSYVEDLLNDPTARIDELEERVNSIKNVLPEHLKKHLKDLESKIDELQSSIDDLENS